ncbi:MAG: DUF5682 family protein [Oscillochloridaceae bacterium umkhey_bin13]
MTEPSHHIFGIRHHGPGSAHSLRRALMVLQPDLVLIEGPPEADDLLPLLAEPDLEPPVALLVYAVDSPRQAAFFPLTHFSPEFQAIQYALAHGLPVRCIDLPQSHQLAFEASEGGAALPLPTEPVLDPQAQTEALIAQPAYDPLGALAAAAGHSDGEQWWEQLIEQRADEVERFQAILEAMQALRETHPHPHTQREAQREAWMRQQIRLAQRQGFRRIAVVCGAWHAPALTSLADAKADAALLRDLPKLKVTATLAPWSNSRLSLASGYGAGVHAPGWYEHLWQQHTVGGGPGASAAHWLARVAQVLRNEGFEASAAHVVEAVRLAEALAALREQPMAGFRELEEASRAVFCFGSDAPLRLIHERLVVGERLGQVPARVPAVPLQQDLRREQRRLRLNPEASWRDLELDLRKPNHREQGILLRRLNLIGVTWGQLIESSSKGTFRERWRIAWEPAFDLSLIEAAQWGTTVASAATARAMDQAEQRTDLTVLVSLVTQALFAELPEALGPLLAQLEARATTSGDATALMEALTVEDRQTRSSLSASLRYGSVRELDASLIGQVLDGMVARICIGLPNACSSLDDDAAGAMFGRICATDAALSTMQRPGHAAAWHAAVGRVATTPGVHGLVAGRCVRILLDAGALDATSAAQQISQALSPAVAPGGAAAWFEGLLRGSGLLLLHDERLWNLLDSWLSRLSAESFMAVLPMLRRTCASFALGERRMLGARAAQRPSEQTTASQASFDEDRGAAALALVATIYGINDL